MWQRRGTSASTSFVSAIPIPSSRTPGPIPELRLEARRDACRHERADIATHGGDLPDERGGDVARGRRCRQEYRLHVRRHRAIHPGHLHLIIEIGGIAEA